MTAYNGILFALLTTLSWSIGLFPFTQAARRMGSNVLNHFRLPLATLLLAITAFIIDSAALADLFRCFVPQAWLWFALSGIVGLTLGDYFGFSMYAILGARIGSVLATLAPPATLVLAALLIDERMNVTGIIGIFITIIGVISISLGRRERVKIPDHGHGSIASGIIFGVLSAFCQGAGLVMAKKGIAALDAQYKVISPVHHTFMRVVAATLSLYIFSLISGQLKGVISGIKKSDKATIRYAIAGTMFGPFIGVSLSLYTITLIDVAVAQTIFSLMPAIVMLISFFFFKDKISLQSVIGAITAIGGVVILIWRNEVTAWVSSHLLK